MKKLLILWMVLVAFASCTDRKDLFDSGRVKEEAKENLDEWYTITLYRLVEVARKVSSKYTRSKVRKAIKNEFAYIIDELLHAQINSEKDKVYYYKQIIKTIIERNNNYSALKKILFSES